jgi:hypothetical protein
MPGSLKLRLCTFVLPFVLPLVPLVLPTGGALAQDDAFVISALREPVRKSYRRMLEGASLFAARQHLAPAAALRFKLLPRKPGTAMEGIELAVAADSLAIPLQVAADRTFVLERSALALKENAQVVPNRKAGTLTWRADVRTPGLPADVRRLGDLRLECEAGMKSGLISNYPSGFFGWLEEMFGKGPEFCHRPKPRYLFFAERALFGVTLVDGARREALPLEMLYAGASRDPKWKEDRYCDCEALFDRTYFVPLGDTSWPDDTRVELEYMEMGETSGETRAITREIARAVLGETRVLDFAGGYEVWEYGDLVLLFEPGGTLAKARVR